MNKIYIHMGTSKTGTSAIQNLCNENVDILQEMGIYYPMEYVLKDASGFMCGPGNIGRLFMIDKESHSNIAYKISECVREHEISLISSECIWYEVTDKAAFLQEIKKHLGEVEIVVIVYLREQYEYLKSLFLEHVKLGTLSCTPQNYFEYILKIGGEIKEDEKWILEDIVRTVQYYNDLKSIESVVGKDNLIIREYDRKMLHNNDICDDFFGILGIDRLDKFKENKIDANPSIDLSMAFVARALNEVKGKDIRKNIDVKKILLENTVLKRSKYNTYENEQRYSAEVRKNFVNENLKISKEFFEGRVLFNSNKEMDAYMPTEFYSKVLEDVIRIMIDIDNGQAQAIKRQWWQSEKLSKDMVTNKECMENIENKVWQLEQEIKVAKEKNSNVVIELMNSNNAYVAEILRLKSELEAIKSSTSWKITAPMRKVMDFIRGNNK